MFALAQSYPVVRLKAIFSDKKTGLFAMTCAVAAFVTSVIGYKIAEALRSTTGGIIATSIWDAIICVGIGLAFVWVQNGYMRNKAAMKSEMMRVSLRCALGGAAGGTALVITKSMIGGNFGHIAGWTLEGLIMGWLLAPVFPNLPRKPATIGGLLAGFLGGWLSPFFGALIGSALGVAAADSLKGLFLAAMLTITEKFHAISDGSLIIHWGPNEQSTILLGEKSIAIGSDPKCQIYLKREDSSCPDIVAEIIQTNGKNVLHDKKNGKTINLPDRTIINIGHLKIEAREGVKVTSQDKK